MLHPEEAAELKALPDSARAEGFGRAWVRKEAYLKALGTGLPATWPWTTWARPRPTRNLPGWTVTDIQAPQGYLAAAALRS